MQGPQTANAGRLLSLGFSLSHSLPRTLSPLPPFHPPTLTGVLASSCTRLTPWRFCVSTPCTIGPVLACPDLSVPSLYSLYSLFPLFLSLLPTTPLISLSLFLPFPLSFFPLLSPSLFTHRRFVLRIASLCERLSPFLSLTSSCLETTLSKTKGHALSSSDSRFLLSHLPFSFPFVHSFLGVIV